MDTPLIGRARSSTLGLTLASLGALALVGVVGMSHLSSHSALVSDDFAWQRGYSWYPDTPGAYPAGKTSWYYDNGGLYDQAHVPGYTTTASYTKAPVGSLATVAGPDGEEYALVPLDTEDGMGMERKGPEFLSSNPQMQILTCFGHCGAECQAYCQENYLKCTHNDGAVGQNGFPNTYLEPGPDYYAPTGRGHGGADHVNWCQATLDRCKGHCQ